MIASDCFGLAEELSRGFLSRAGVRTRARLGHWLGVRLLSEEALTGGWVQPTCPSLSDS